MNTETTPISITVDASIIDAAICAASKEDTRYYLRGVFLDARGFVAATNGHLVFAARCSDAFKLAGIAPTYLSDALAGIIIPRDTIAQASKAAGKSRGVHITVDRDMLGQWWITYGNARVAFAPVDGSFPDWTRVVPQAPDALVAAHYDHLYLTALGRMAQALHDGKKSASTMFRLHQNGDNPALVTFASSDGGILTNCCAVLMPIRTKDDEYATGSDFTDCFIGNAST